MTCSHPTGLRRLGQVIPLAADDASAEVRLVPLTAPARSVARAEKWLTPEERERARRGTARVYVRRVLLRAALRELVGQRLGIHPAEVRLRSTAAGRPELDAPDEKRLDVSCAAGDGVGLVAVARGARVGVDLEPLASWSTRWLTEGWLSPAERAALLALPVPARAYAATVSWTQKEAVLKGRGVGLPGGAASVGTPVGRTEGSVAGWDVRPVAVPDGHVATLATRSGHIANCSPRTR
jgi:4'-phosphopantetheinyl transferase